SVQKELTMETHVSMVYGLRQVNKPIHHLSKNKIGTEQRLARVCCSVFPCTAYRDLTQLIIEY
ncbi:hypothetical protein V2E39_23785, partial [Chryseobacterium arthrosphaerae]